METPNVKVIIYDLKFKIGETLHNHSIIKIIPPITVTEHETGIKRKVSLSKMSGGRKINIHPEAYLRPTLLSKKLDSSYNAHIHIITDLEKYLYFLYSPDIIKDNLTMLLVTPCDISRKINTSFEVKEFNLEFLSNKLFPQWKHHAESSLKFKGEIEISYPTELLKDKENELLVMKKLIKLGHQTQHHRIWNSHRTSVQNKILEYKLWRLTHECFNFISSFCETILGINKENSQNFFSQKTFSDFLIPSSKYLIFSNTNCKRSSWSSLSIFEDEFRKEDVDEFISGLASLKKYFNSISKDEIRKSKCSFLLESVFEDLLDPHLPELLKCGKTAFLRFFSLGGIPSLAKISKKSQENPWNLIIWEIDRKKVSQTVSQTVFNNSLDQYVLDDEGENKRALEEKREAVNLYDDVGFNTVVPVFTPKLATILKKLLRTNVLRSVCSYCILKNPFLSNVNAHLSALVSLWMKLIFENDDDNRSEFTQGKIKSICSTAATYLDSPLNKKYKKALFGSPELALREYLYSDDDAAASPSCSRSRSRSHDDSRYKVCSETLSKALFFLYIYRAEVREDKKIKILYLLVLEFFKRIFSILWSARGLNLKYLRFYIFASLADPKDQSIDHYICIANKFLEEKPKKIDKMTSREVRKYCQKFKNEFINEKGFNLSYIQEFRSSQRIGSFSLKNLRERAPALFGIPEVAVSQIFQTENLFSYAYHYLGKSRHSWTSALGKQLLPYEKSRILVRSKLQMDFQNDIYKRVYDYLLKIKTEK
nr:MAG: hypothetical protein [Porcellio scaber clopovirus]